MIYCDTSVLVAALAAEVNSFAVQAWLNDYKDQVAVSEWVGTELSSALAMKRRLGVLDNAAWLRATQAWHTLRDTQLVTVSIMEQDFIAASDLIERPDLALRSGDALHLAIAIRHVCSLATLDKKFADAAQTMSVNLTQVLPSTPT